MATFICMENNIQTVTMATQLIDKYGDIISVEDLSHLAVKVEPTRIDEIVINNVTYDASYFGTVDVSEVLVGFSTIATYRIEEAYDQVSNIPPNGDVYPIYNYPMEVNLGEVFLLEATMIDGSVVGLFYRADGNTWENIEVTTGFSVEYQLNKTE